MSTLNIPKLWIDRAQQNGFGDRSAACNFIYRATKAILSSTDFVSARAGMIMFVLSRLPLRSVNRKRLEMLTGINAVAASFVVTDLECKGLVSVDAGGPEVTVTLSAKGRKFCEEAAA